MLRRAVAEVNLAAIERNARTLLARLSPGTRLCAVVKADGYGHGAVPAARAALRGGASALAVATAAEASELRAAGLEAPVLVLGAVSQDELPEALAAGAELVAWDERFVALLRRRSPVGARCASTSSSTAASVASGRGRPKRRSRWRAPSSGGAGAEIAGAMTHFATADDDLEFSSTSCGFRPARRSAACRARHRWSSMPPTAPARSG